MPAVPDVAALAPLVAAYRPGGLPLVVTPDAAAAVRGSLDAAGLVLLGETHGVRETPRVLFALMVELGIGGLALEWSIAATPAVEAWRAGGPLPAHEQLWTGDGRVTAGHLALLREPWPVTLFDVEFLAAGATWSDRDAGMAANLLAAPSLPGGRLVVAGNYHTRLAPVEPGVPMGVHVAAARPGVRTIDLRYRSGRVYNEEPGEIGPVRPGPHPPPTLHLTGGRLYLDVEEAHEADVPHRRWRDADH